MTQQISKIDKKANKQNCRCYARKNRKIFRTLELFIYYLQFKFKSLKQDVAHLFAHLSAMLRGGRWFVSCEIMEAKHSCYITHWQCNLSFVCDNTWINVLENPFPVVSSCIKFAIEQFRYNSIYLMWMSRATELQYTITSRTAISY